jgi:hypothetical protein
VIVASDSSADGRIAIVAFPDAVPVGSTGGAVGSGATVAANAADDPAPGSGLDPALGSRWFRRALCALRRCLRLGAGPSGGLVRSQRAVVGHRHRPPS